MNSPEIPSGKPSHSMSSSECHPPSSVRHLPGASTTCDKCYELFNATASSGIGPNGGFLCETCDEFARPPRGRRRESSLLVANPGSGRETAKTVNSREARPPAGRREQGPYASDYASNSEQHSNGTRHHANAEYFMQPPASKPPDPPVATAHPQQPHLFTPSNTENPCSSSLPHSKTRRKAYKPNSENMGSEYVLSAGAAASQKRTLSGTPEPTPTKRVKGLLAPGFSTPEKTSTSPLQLPPLATPPTTKRPVGLFGSQARKLARGNRGALNFNENDLPADQALPLYQQMSQMINDLPEHVHKPVIEIAKRLRAVEDENVMLKAKIEGLETRVDESMRRMEAQLDKAFGRMGGMSNVGSQSA